jgi:hypothetical protein
VESTFAGTTGYRQSSAAALLAGERLKAAPIRLIDGTPRLLDDAGHRLRIAMQGVRA